MSTVKDNLKKASIAVAVAGLGVVGVLGASPLSDAIQDKQNIGKHKVQVMDVYLEDVDNDGSDDAVIVLTRAWKNGKQIGFSKNGSVDIEKFRFFDICLWDDVDTTDKLKLKGELKKQVDSAIGDTFNLLEERIKKGKIGSTVSTFYPDEDPESTSFDGFMSYNQSLQTWATVHDYEGGANVSIDDTSGLTQKPVNWEDNTSVWLDGSRRSMFLFDSSALPDDDEISAATFSFYTIGKAEGHGTTGIGIVLSDPASNTGLSNTDWPDFGTTRQATDITIAALSTGAYNDWALNATGISNVSKTGITKFGMRSSWDIDDTEPSKTGNDTYLSGKFADVGSDKPKLTVTHAVAVTWTPKAIIY